MFRSYFGLSTVENKAAIVGKVFKLDGEFVVIHAEHANGMVSYRYENDRTNRIYSTLFAFMS